ncbi:MAG: S1 RNA-binding domain-containing protein [Planctomycetota bacterium]
MNRRDPLAALRTELDEALGRGPNEKGLYSATLAGISGGDVIVELGPRVQGAIPLDEFDDEPVLGGEVDVSLRGREDSLWTFSIQEARALAAWSEIEVGSLVSGTVIGVNKGGLELRIGKLTAFCPASQAALGRVEDLTTFGGQSLVCEVVEIDSARQRVVVSRRAVLEAERETSRAAVVSDLTPGAVVRGKVKRIEPFGAFLEVAPGVEGLLHVSQISHVRVEDPNDALKVGQDLEVQILEITEGGKRIALGRKQLESDPWDVAQERFRPDLVVNGIVRRVADFGAFVELEPGLEGLVHVSQTGVERGRSLGDVFQVGGELAVRVLNVDPVQRRIGLSRLDPSGAVLGSDEALDASEMKEFVDTTNANSGLGTNLGSLFKKALEKE